MIFRFFPGALGACGILLASVSSAQAAFLFCNQTKTLIEAAFGYHEGPVWTSEGWWQIQPGQCARVFSKPLTQRFYFYYARTLAPAGTSGREPMVWSGKYAFCTGSKAFRAVGDSECESRGYRMQGFQEIDIGPNRRDYTLNFYDRTR